MPLPVVSLGDLQLAPLLEALPLALVHGWPVLLSAFFAGFVDSIGGGGGLISVPAFLAAGVPYHLLLGTNKSMACLGCGVSVIRYARAGLLPRRSWVTWVSLILIAALCGAVGAALSTLPFVLGNLRYLVPILLVAVMVFLIRKWFWEKKTEPRPVSPEALEQPANRAVLGLIAGYDGIFGPGTGTLFLSFLERIGFPTLSANAITKVLNLSSNLGALLWFGIQGLVLWPVGLAAALAFMAGNYAGSGLVLRRGQSLVRITVVLMTSLLLAKYAWTR